jgi:hypothetical protein
MKNYPVKNNLSKIYLSFSLIVITVAFLASCRVTLVAPYDSRVSQKIEDIAQKVDKFYLTMLETTHDENNEREYSKFVDDYIDVEVELNSLLNMNRIRPLNKESTKNCQIAVDTWVKYKEKHKENNTISNIDIELNRDFLRDLFTVIQIGEEVKKNAN